METLSTYLDELKNLKKLERDADVARFLGVTRTHVSQIRGGAYMGELKCYELALALRRDPIELLSLNRALRTKDRKLKNYWLLIHRKASSG
jgi:hypothetical protein